MNTIIKIILIILLLVCLADMPYGYYQFVRFVASIAFVYFAFQEYQSRPNSIWIWIFIGLALLFQPFFKVALGRTLWNIVDVFTAIILLFSISSENTSNKPK